MALKSFKPTTPAQRQLVIVDRSELWKGKPVKTLTEGKTKSGGRNNRGRLTAFRVGGGHKKTYRIIDFKRRKFDVAATVERIEYDPNRSSFIALIKYADGELAYILAPQRLAVGDTVVAGERADIKPGNAMRLKNIPVGTIVHNVEMKEGKGGQLARAAGTYVQLVGKDGGYTKQVADACSLIPIVSDKRITPHTEGLAAVVWHLLVSHPALQLKETKWESVAKSSAQTSPTVNA